MSEQNIIQSARDYVSNLLKAAGENGFKPAESWDLRLVDASAKRALQRNYYPTVAAGLIPAAVTQFIKEVKAAMARSDASFTRVGNIDLKTCELQFLVAYNAKRPRR